MGQLQRSCEQVNMAAQIASLLCLLLAPCAIGQQNSNKLPVLFQFSQPSHNVAVFRGADLKAAIAAGIVPGFGSLQKGSANADEEDRNGRSDDESDADASASDDDASTSGVDASASDADASASNTGSNASYTAAVAPTPAPAPKAVNTYTPAPIVYKPAPIAYRPAPVVYRPAQPQVVYQPAPTRVVYNPAPAPVSYKPAPAVSYKPYVDPYPAEKALYTYEYAVKDDYTSNDFGAREARDGALTNGQYNVVLPDGRLQTVTYTVSGGEGYVADVQYVGEPQYPAAVAPTYSS